MKLEIDTMNSLCQGDIIQSVFMRIDLKSYFTVIASMTGDARFKHSYKELERYTHLDPVHLVYMPFEMGCDAPPKIEDITVGEILCAARNMLDHNAILPEDAYTPELSVLDDAGMKIVKAVLVEPLNALSKIRKDEK